MFEQYLMVRITRGLKAFLNLEAGVVGAESSVGDQSRLGTPRWIQEDRTGGSQQIEELLRRERKRTGAQRRLIEKQAEELDHLRARAKENDADARGLNPRNIVWMFSDGRSGSTWLARMVGDLAGHTVWREPNVGTLFGQHYYVWANDNQRGSDNFILGLRNKDSWLKSIRRFVLDEARSRFPNLSQEEYLFVKEPFGSVGAPLLMQAIPESRMVFLVRDPRDVVASALDAHRKGAWSYWRTKAATHEAKSLAEDDPDNYVKERAKRYLRHVRNSKEAFDAHRGYKVMVRYEELRADALATMKRLYRDLDITVDENRLARVVENRSWENIPEERKGEGKFHRKAQPGGWREDLSPEQAAIVENITAPLLKEFYPT